MKTLFFLIVLAALCVFAGAGFIYSGVYNIGADDPHWAPTHKLIQILRERSIAVRAEDLEVPADLGDTERARRGAGNYAAMCVGCHLAPGIEDSEIRKGLYPQPPKLAMTSDGHGDSTRSAARQFWIIKHGVKASGMPSWSKGGMDDGTIWDMVALLQELPVLSPAEYKTLVDTSAGHSHEGADSHGHSQGQGDASHDEMVSGHRHGAAGHSDGDDDEHGRQQNGGPESGGSAGHVDAPGTPPHGHGEDKKVESDHEDDDHAH
jgi:hypothetical protein